MNDIEQAITNDLNVDFYPVDTEVLSVSLTAFDGKAVALFKVGAVHRTAIVDVEPGMPSKTISDRLWARIGAKSAFAF